MSDTYPCGFLVLKRAVLKSNLDIFSAPAIFNFQPPHPNHRGCITSYWDDTLHRQKSILHPAQEVVIILSQLINNTLTFKNRTALLSSPTSRKTSPTSYIIIHRSTLKTNNVTPQRRIRTSHLHLRGCLSSMVSYGWFGSCRFGH